MKVRLLYPDRPFRPAADLPAQSDQVAEDLGADTMLKVMANGDDHLLTVARSVLFQSLTDVNHVTYRQQVLTDCLHHPHAVLEIHALAVSALEVERGLLWSWKSDNPSRDIYRSRNCLVRYVEQLRALRGMADEYAEIFSSPGLQALCEDIRTNLPDSYLDEVDSTLALLKFQGGVQETLHLGRANEGVEHVLRTPRRPSGLTERLGLDWTRHTVTVAARDMAGMDSLAELKDHGLALAASVLSASVDHVKEYFNALRLELSWYLACLHLHEALTGAGQSTCFPQPRRPGSSGTVARGLYDPMLVVHGNQTPTSSDLDSDGAGLIVITGANQGGKSTFLRALGLAQLMIDSGLFVAAESFSGELSTGVYTHFKREEDSTMTSGKFDEELSRMSAVVESITPGAVLLCNESFSSTNEREAALVGGDLIAGLLEAGVRVRLVTHLYEFAARLHRGVENAAFLRADRRDDGTRNHEIVPGDPLRTSYGADLYEEVFGEPLPAPGVTSRP